MVPLQKATLKPAYDKSLEQLFINITRIMIEDSGFLDAVCMTQRGLSGRNTNLPSWVPDWRIPANHPDHYDMRKVRRIKEPHKADKVADITLAAPEKHEEHILLVKGTVLDRVACFADDRKCSTGGWIELAKPWIADELPSPTKADSEATSQELLDAYTTLVRQFQHEWDHLEGSTQNGDPWMYEEELYRREKLDATFLRWLRDCPCAFDLMRCQAMYTRHMRLPEYWDEHGSTSAGKFRGYLAQQIHSPNPTHRSWKFCATARGIWATVPHDSTIGDYIVHVDGALESLVVRPHHEEPGVLGGCQLVGTSFVQQFSQFLTSHNLKMRIDLKPQIFSLF